VRGFWSWFELAVETKATPFFPSSLLPSQIADRPTDDDAHREFLVSLPRNAFFYLFCSLKRAHSNMLDSYFARFSN
jgi:hypothetical protein